MKLDLMQIFLSPALTGLPRLPGRRNLSKRLVSACVLCYLVSFPMLVAGQRVEGGLPSVGIVVRADEPRYVHRAVEDLKAQLELQGREAPTIYRAFPQALQGPESTLIFVGQAAQEAIGRQGRTEPPESDLGAEGYVIRSLPASTGGKETVVVFGKDPHGTNYGVLDLAYRVSTGQADVLSKLEVRTKPRYRLRGMYAHQHWAYYYPYALRSWKLEDWKRYIDILAQFRVNLLQFWTMAGIIPDPPSAADWDYLRKYEEVVRYAKEERGFQQVWPGECANNIATSSFGKSIEEREYFVVEDLRNPADPGGFQEIMDNRRNMYKACPNADGYFILDSDPGKWVGSPASDFVKVFEGNWQLIQQYHRGSARAKLVYWMLFGWGSNWPQDYKIDAEAIRGAVRGLEDQFKGDYWTLAHNEIHLKIVQDFNRVDRTVFFPYGTIEHEPSPPLTQITYKVVRDRYKELEGYPTIAGMMGNAQTPLVQFPNIYFFHSMAWDPEYGKKPDREIIRNLAMKIYPEIAEDLTEGWYQLSQDNPAACRKAADRLDELRHSNRVGRPGVVGRYLFPDGLMLLRDLATTLRMHASALDTVAALEADSGDETQIADSVLSYLTEALRLQERKGYHVAPMRDGTDWLAVRPWYLQGPDYDAIRGAWKDHVSRHPCAGGERLIESTLASLQQTTFDPKVYGRMIDFLFRHPVPK